MGLYGTTSENALLSEVLSRCSDWRKSERPRNHFNFQIGSGAQPASYPVGMEESSGGIKRPARESECIHVPNVKVKGTRSCSPLPYASSWHNAYWTQGFTFSLLWTYVGISERAIGKLGGGWHRLMSMKLLGYQAAAIEGWIKANLSVAPALAIPNAREHVLL
jgi:hypothetical protein